MSQFLGWFKLFSSYANLAERCANRIFGLEIGLIKLRNTPKIDALYYTNVRHLLSAILSARLTEILLVSYFSKNSILSF